MKGVYFIIFCCLSILLSGCATYYARMGYGPAVVAAPSACNVYRSSCNYRPIRPYCRQYECTRCPTTYYSGWGYSQCPEAVPCGACVTQCGSCFSPCDYSYPADNCYPCSKVYMGNIGCAGFVPLTPATCPGTTVIRNPYPLYKK